MAKSVHFGIGAKARKGRKMYFGVGGKARKVKKAYVGIGGRARLFFSAGVQAGAYSILNRSNFVLARWEPPTMAVISQINVNAYINAADYPQIPCGATDTGLFISSGTTSRMLDPITGAVLKTVTAPSVVTSLSGGLPGIVAGSKNVSGRSWTAVLFDQDTLAQLRSGTVTATFGDSIVYALCTGGDAARIFAYECVRYRDDGQTDYYGGYRVLDALTFAVLFTYGYYGNSSTSAYPRFMGDWYKGIPYYVSNRNFHYGDVAIYQCDPNTYARQTLLYSHTYGSAASPFAYASTFTAVKG
jgi:hypothetical protein